MTTPPTPPAPPAPTPSPPSPPTPPPAPPAPPTGGPPTPPPTPPAGPELEAALAEERRARRELEAELAKLKQQGMTDQEKALAKAREEGKAEAAHAAALVVAAAEFRVQAAGKIADPEAALAVIDLAKLVDKDDHPDKAAITKLVGQLAAVPPKPGHVPPGPRDPGANGDGDWIREQMGRSR
jgi:flagellar biosynthesis/type III secretory pathway protein FliH